MLVAEERAAPGSISGVFIDVRLNKIDWLKSDEKSVVGFTSLPVHGIKFELISDEEIFVEEMFGVNIVKSGARGNILLPFERSFQFQVEGETTIS